MPPLRLPVRISGEAAVSYFTRPRLTNLFGLLAKPARIASPGDPATRVPPFIERLWMPAYAVCLRATTPKKKDTIWVSVDGWAGQFALFEPVNELTAGELEEDSFPPHLEESQAIELARKGLLQYILRQRGQMNKPVVEGIEAVKVYYFPLWVYYYRRRRRFLDIRVLDGYNGRPGGAKMRVALVNAMVAARKTRTKNASPAERSSCNH